MLNNVSNLVDKIENQQPTILCIGNFISTTTVYNTLLAVGANPIISCDLSEIEEIIVNSRAIYINIDSVNQSFIQLSNSVVSLAKKYNKLLILESSGAGKTGLRTFSSFNLLPHVNIIKGNPNEIISLSQKNIVNQNNNDVNYSVEDAINVADYLALKYNSTIVVNGDRIYVTDGIKNYFINYGSPLLKKIASNSSALGAIMSAANAVEQDSCNAAYLIAVYFNVCAELVEKISNGPMSFQVNLIDTLYNKPFDVISDYIKSHQK